MFRNTIPEKNEFYLKKDYKIRFRCVPLLVYSLSKKIIVYNIKKRINNSTITFIE